MARKAGHVDMRGVGTAVSKLPQFRARSKMEAFKIMNRAKLQLLQEFTEHPVTMEIDAGPTSENISNTLGGAGGNGNLFTFIGFDAGSHPTAPIKIALEEMVRLGAVNSRAPSGAEDATVLITILHPTVKDLRPFAPMPWEPGKNWVEGIEEGIGGFGEYMKKKFDAGRSKWGLQSAHQVRKSSFRPVSYVSDLVRRFVTRVYRHK